MSVSEEQFSEEQKHYLQGFAAGSGLMRSMPLAVLQPLVGGSSSTAQTEGKSSGPDGPGRLAQDRFISAGKKLCAEENTKRNKNALDLWDEVAAHAREGRFPKG